ncbi:MAG: hypothetical protein ACOCUS_01205 [Polyangiales bacterium]
MAATSADVGARILTAIGLALLLLGGCGGGCGSDGDLEGCRKGCEKLGLVPGGRMCDTVCTTDCDELVETYGMNDETCRRLQAGEL